MPQLSYILMAAAIAAAVYGGFEPVRAALAENVFRQRAHVSRELREMFIFIPADRLQIVKWSLFAALAVLGLVVAWEAPNPGPWVAAIVLGTLGYWGPELIILVLRRRRRAAFSSQLVDGLVLLANGLRSGFSFTQAMQMMVDETPAPLSQEFRLVQEEVRLGVDLDQALQNCVTRTKDADLELVVTAIKITRQMGGNLPEVFERIVAMTRDRKLITGKARALTASGRMQASVVGLLPVGFALIVSKMNPELMRLLWTTMSGFLVLLLAIALDVIGYLWVLKLSRIKY